MVMIVLSRSCLELEDLFALDDWEMTMAQKIGPPMKVQSFPACDVCPIVTEYPLDYYLVSSEGYLCAKWTVWIWHISFSMTKIQEYSPTLPGRCRTCGIGCSSDWRCPGGWSPLSSRCTTRRTIVILWNRSSRRSHGTRHVWNENCTVFSGLRLSRIQIMFLYVYRGANKDYTHRTLDFPRKCGAKVTAPIAPSATNLKRNRYIYRYIVDWREKEKKRNSWGMQEAQLRNQWQRGRNGFSPSIACRVEFY